MASICANQQSPTVIVGGVEDHSHSLLRLGKAVDILLLIREIKRDSSCWIKRELRIANFYWQTGYGAFSISPGHVDSLKAYIANQEQHHHGESFQDEFRRLCNLDGLDPNERDLWD